MHPARPAAFADYAAEKRSKFDMWWAFGWPYETSVAMGRLVFSGIFDRHPGLKIITHHLGAMVPFCAGRVGGGLDQLGSRSDDAEDTGALARLRKRPIDYFKMFQTRAVRRVARDGIRPLSSALTTCSEPTCRSTPRRVRIHPRYDRGDARMRATEEEKATRATRVCRSGCVQMRRQR